LVLGHLLLERLLSHWTYTVCAGGVLRRLLTSGKNSGFLNVERCSMVINLFLFVCFGLLFGAAVGAVGNTERRGISLLPHASGADRSTLTKAALTSVSNYSLKSVRREGLRGNTYLCQNVLKMCQTCAAYCTSIIPQ
jgi:hypothetical protein